MRLIIASCLLFAVSMAQTGSDCPAIRMYGGVCDDPIQVDVVYILDRDQQGVDGATSEANFNALTSGPMSDLLDNFVNPAPDNTDKNLAFGMVTVDGAGVFNDGTSGGSILLPTTLNVNAIKSVLESRTLGTGTTNTNFLDGITAGVNMLTDMQDIGQSQVLVVFVDKDTWASADKSSCSSLYSEMQNNNLLVLFVGIGLLSSTVSDCITIDNTITFFSAQTAGYTNLAVTSEENEVLCGVDRLESYFGDYTFASSAVSTDSKTRYSFALNSQTVSWSNDNWEVTSATGTVARGASSDHPFPPYSLFYFAGLATSGDMLAKCYNPPTLSPTQEPTVEPTDNPSPYQYNPFLFFLSIFPQ